MIARTALVALLGMGLVAPVFAKPGGINAREHRQMLRIKDGKEDGELTRRELDKLLADQAAVRAEERIYRKGGLQPWERRDLERDLNTTSREIYKATHNGRAPR